MKIVATSLIILSFVNLIRGQSEVDSEKVMGDSGSWSRRITKINRREGAEELGGLANQDKQRHDGRWPEEQTIIRDSRRRPRPFASVLTSNAETSFQDRFESRREKFHNGKEAAAPIATFDFNAPTEPSPILLPPFATPAPVYQIYTISEENATEPESNDVSSANTGKSSTSSAPKQIRIYEITTSNSTDAETEKNETNHVDDSHESFNIRDGKQATWLDFPREPYTATSTFENEDELDRKLERNDFRSSFLDHGARKAGISDFDSSENRTQSHFRGNRKYQSNYDNRKVFMRKKTFSQSFKHDWARRSGQRSHFFVFDDDTRSEVGSVPGVPGRDYPIHQEHTHHHLRNVVDRFPCPRGPKSHVYLADRASRCQIFYVCYGSKTGIPMVCPNGTLFSEPLQVCDWWYNVAC
ncbi:uncharacterized protein [Venturia canescens]|uniref:uncharacterized protein n=1 Tax=Venturia canescens TaxID=32260 RepID=UPI001C9CD2D5|nr:uncharacterized protein LOC122406464 [Venturia canescens]